MFYVSNLLATYTILALGRTWKPTVPQLCCRLEAHINEEIRRSGISEAENASIKVKCTAVCTRTNELIIHIKMDVYELTLGLLVLCQ